VSRLAIGIVTSGGEENDQLIALLKKQGVDVCYILAPDAIESTHIKDQSLHVWLLNVDDESWDDRIDELLDQSEAPVYFNEPGTLQKQTHPEFWCQNLIKRLIELTGLAPESFEQTPAEADSKDTPGDDNEETTNEAPEIESDPKNDSAADASLKALDEALEELDSAKVAMPEQLTEELVSELEEIAPQLKHAPIEENLPDTQPLQEPEPPSEEELQREQQALAAEIEALQSDTAPSVSEIESAESSESLPESAASADGEPIEDAMDFGELDINLDAESEFEDFDETPDAPEAEDFFSADDLSNESLTVTSEITEAADESASESIELTLQDMGTANDGSNSSSPAEDTQEQSVAAAEEAVDIDFDSIDFDLVEDEEPKPRGRAQFIVEDDEPQSEPEETTTAAQEEDAEDFSFELEPLEEEKARQGKAVFITEDDIEEPLQTAPEASPTESEPEEDEPGLSLEPINESAASEAEEEPPVDEEARQAEDSELNEQDEELALDTQLTLEPLVDSAAPEETAEEAPLDDMQQAETGDLEENASAEFEIASNLSLEPLEETEDAQAEEAEHEQDSFPQSDAEESQDMQSDLELVEDENSDDIFDASGDAELQDDDGLEVDVQTSAQTEVSSEVEALSLSLGDDEPPQEMEPTAALPEEQSTVDDLDTDDATDTVPVQADATQNADECATDVESEFPQVESSTPESQVNQLEQASSVAAEAVVDIPMLEEAASHLEFEPEATTDQEPTKPTTQCWVLGASLGGPAAVKQFLQNLPADIDACFIIAQHIDESFLPVLAEILSTNTRFEVAIANGSVALEAGKVLLSPLQGKIVILSDGSLMVDRTQKWSEPYSPCIDDVITAVAEVYGERAGAVIFSGMGQDGMHGARKLKQAGGRVWAQQPETCANASMPQAIIDNQLADVVASPQELAAQLATVATGKSVSSV